MANQTKAINVGLARALASRNIASADIKAAAKRLSKIDRPVLKLDVCPFGICGDWWLTPDELNDGIADILSFDVDLGEVRIFKYGIIDPDFFLVQAEMNMEGLRGA